MTAPETCRSDIRSTMYVRYHLCRCPTTSTAYEMPPCEQCSAVTLASLLSSEDHPHHKSYAVLKKAAATCEACYIICIHLQPKLAIAMAQSTEHGEPTNPNDWDTILGKFGTSITLQRNVGYDLDVAKGQPRKIKRDPTNRSWLNVRCGRSKANAIDKSASTQPSRGTAPTDLKDIDVQVSVHVFVYEGTSTARARTCCCKRMTEPQATYPRNLVFNSVIHWLPTQWPIASLPR